MEMKDTTFMIRGTFMDAITLEIPQKHNLTTTTKTRRGERAKRENLFESTTMRCSGTSAELRRDRERKRLGWNVWLCFF